MAKIKSTYNLFNILCTLSNKRFDSKLITMKISTIIHGTHWNKYNGTRSINKFGKQTYGILYSLIHA